jgi:hypothetical protein
MCVECCHSNSNYNILDDFQVSYRCQMYVVSISKALASGISNNWTSPNVIANVCHDWMYERTVREMQKE